MRLYYCYIAILQRRFAAFSPEKCLLIAGLRQRHIRNKERRYDIATSRLMMILPFYDALRYAAIYLLPHFRLVQHVLFHSFDTRYHSRRQYSAQVCRHHHADFS